MIDGTVFFDVHRTVQSQDNLFIIWNLLVANDLVVSMYVTVPSPWADFSEGHVEVGIQMVVDGAPKQNR